MIHVSIIKYFEYHLFTIHVDNKCFGITQLVSESHQVWSNGMYQSNERRALTNEEKARMSPATFIPPDENVKIRQ